MNTQTQAAPMEGIVDFTGPVGANAGFFALPPSFDQKTCAAQWVKVVPEVPDAILLLYFGMRQNTTIARGTRRDGGN